MESSLCKHGVVGRTEFRHDSMNGLLLRVSKQKWVTVGQNDMYLVKLRSNITAVCVFTALCQVEALSLKQYILGQHLVDDAHKKVSSSGKNKHAMLYVMGGSDALGKGFIHYVQHNFNPSQLAVISAAAEEYGDGGFTLCKGRT